MGIDNKCMDYMITKLFIKNFKSVKEAELECSKINVFIGEPNTGKSNILETIALLHLFVDQRKDLTEENFRSCSEFHNGVSFSTGRIYLMR
jgi:AAA15 family ATPase/GTPase